MISVEFGIGNIFRSADGKSAKITQAPEPEFFPYVETGRYEVDRESVVCLSTQIGCPMACSFCRSTGPFLFYPDASPKRWLRNLRASEIIIQTLSALEAVPPPPDSIGIVFSYMGIGEPFANFPEVKLAIRVLGEVYPHSRTTISTIGFNLNAIRQLADEVASKRFATPVKLHISLHAPIDIQRQAIIPKAKPILDTLAAAEYFARTTQTQVKLNYVLVAGQNDSVADATQLGRLLQNRPGLILKISDLNSPDRSLIVPPDQADAFEAAVKSYGVETCRFVSQGQDINAGCGQFLFSALSLIS